MRTLHIVIIGLLVVVAIVFGWHAIRTSPRQQIAGPSAQPSVAQTSQSTTSQASSPTAPASESGNHLGPFSIAGRDYFVELETKKIRPSAADEQGDTVVAMEIRDAAGAVQYRRAFPYVEAKEDYFESWSVSAHLLTGTNRAGLLVSYDDYFEPSAPEEEPTGWFQVFGVLNGKFVPFGAPLEVQGGLLDQQSDAHTYKVSRPLDAQADSVEFRVWAGHCRLIYPVRVDWIQGKLSSAQECQKSAAEIGNGCQYKVVPEDKLYVQRTTFVRLWPTPEEKSGQPLKTVVKQDSKVELLTAMVATQWMETNAAPTANSKGPMDDAGGFGVAANADLWLKVRIDGKEGWVHSEEDFQALGLPEDE